MTVFHHPHAAFEAICEPLRIDERRLVHGVRLDQVEARGETGGQASAALWEHDVGDGHAFEVVYCVGAHGGLEFWHVMYADDTDRPCGDLIAKSEQGLFYWLFFHLIASEFFKHGEHAYSTLAAAAKTVKFAHLVDVMKLEEAVGSDDDRRRELLIRCRNIE